MQILWKDIPPQLEEEANQIKLQILNFQRRLLEFKANQKNVSEHCLDSQKPKIIPEKVEDRGCKLNQLQPPIELTNALNFELKYAEFKEESCERDEDLANSLIAKY